MKKSILLLLLPLLALASWAQTMVYPSPTVEWKSTLTTQEFGYSSTPNFPNEVNVQSSFTYYGSRSILCTSQGVGTDYPTGNSPRYTYNIYASETAMTPIAASDLVAGGSYVLRLYVHYVSSCTVSWTAMGLAYSSPNFTDKTYNLPFTITSKPEVSVKVFGIDKVWDDPFEDPTIDDFNIAPDLRQVTGATTDWNDVKDYLEFKRIENGTDVGSYVYTLAIKGVHPSYTIHVDNASGLLNITQATNVINSLSITGWTYGETANAPVIDYKYGTDEDVVYEYFKGTESLGNTPPTNAGDYSVVATIPETINYKEISETATFTIDKASTPLPVITAVGGPFTYKATIDESAFTVTKESDGALSYTYEFKAPGETAYTAVAGFDGSAGDWKVYAHQAEGTNWYAMDDVTGFEFSVAPKDLTKEMLATWNSPQTYDGTQILTGYEIKDGATKLVNHTDFEYTIEDKDGNTVTSAKNAGTYTYTFTGKGNYTNSFTAELVVEKAEWPAANITDPVLAATWTYDGTDRNLITTPASATGVIAADVADAADFVYYLDDVETAIADIVAKNANEDPGYKVSYSIKETANYKAVDKKDLTPVIVEKAPLTITGATLNGVYTEPRIKYTKEQLFVCDEDYFAPADKANGQAIAASLITVTLVEGSNTIVVGDEPVELEAGNYTVQLAVNTEAAVQNYKIKKLVDGVLAIAQAENSATVAITGWTYGDAANDPTVAALFGAADVEYTYAKKDETTFSAEVPVNAGEYTVKATIAETKNYKGAEATADFTIAKKALADGMFELSSDKAEFTGTDLKPGYSHADGDPSILAETDFAVVMTNSKPEEVTEMINVGVYTFTFDADAIADGNYKGVITKTFEITPKPIDAKDVEFALETASVTYDGADHKADVVIVPVAPLTEADYEVELPAAEMVNAGEYTITLNADAAGGNYSGTTTATFKIEAKELTDDMFVLSSYEEIYNGEKQNPDVSIADAEKDIMTPADFTVATDPAGDMIDAGTYTFTFTGQGNYTGEAHATFVIAQDEAEFELANAINLTYNGDDQAVVTEAKTDAVDGKVEYQVVQGEKVLVDWTEDFAAVVAKNAGDYTVKTKFTASEINYSNPEVEKEVTVTIEKATIGYNLGGMTKVWDGEAITEEANAEQLAQVFTLYAGGKDGKLFGDDEYDRPFTLSLPEDYRDAGSHKFTAAQAQKGVQFKEGYPVNYKINFAGEGEVFIEKADIAASDFTAPTAIEGLKFTGEAQALVNAGEVTSKTAEDYPNEEIAGEPYGTIVFATAEDGDYTADVPQGTDAGDYEIWWKIAGDINHNDTKAQKIENAAIAAKVIDFAVNFEDADETYDRSDFMPEDVVAYDGETALVADKDYTLTIQNAAGDDVTELINADTYTFTYAAVEGGNYEGSADVVRTITVAPRSLKDEAIAISKFETPKAYTGADQKPTLSISFDEIALTAEEVEVEAAEEMTNAGKYEFKFTGKGNFCDEITATFEITKLKAIAQLENATKVYDGVVGLGDTEVEITWGGLLKGEAAPEVGEGAIIVKDESANVGEYELGIVSENFVSDNYEVVPGDRAAIFSITPAPLMVNWDTEAEPFTKVYGEEDPELSAEGKLSLAGAVEADVPAIVAQTVITRAEGEAVGTYAVTLSADEDADPSVFANYEVTFTGADEAFEIKKAALIVSLAPQTVEYTGVKADLSEKYKDNGGKIPSDQLVVNGLIGDDDKDVVTSFEVVIPDDAIAVGEYQIEVANAVAADYEIEYLPATLTITKAKVTATLTAQKVQKGHELDETAFTAEGILEGDEDYFYVAAPGLADMDGIVTGEAGVYAEGLVLAVDDEVADNYTIVADPAELEIIAADAIVIADNEDWTTEAKEGVDVTFTDRKINAGTWNVIALPFATTVKQVSDAFGYAAVDVLNEDGTTPGEVHFKVISSGDIPAYTPFIVKTTADEGIAKTNFNQVTFHNVNIEAWPEAKNNAITDAAGNEFIGTFKAATPIFGQDMWYMTKGTWYDARKYTEATALTLKAFRAYIHFIEVPAEGARVFIEEPDGSITAINGLQLNNNEANALKSPLT